MFALHIGPAYARNCTSKGSWPAPHRRSSMPSTNSSRRARIAITCSWRPEVSTPPYGNEAAPLDQVLTPLGIKLLPDLDKGCSDYIAKVTSPYTLAQLTKADPFDVPAWKTLLDENDPGTF